VSATQTETSTLIPTGTWTVDPVHSSIRFDVVDTDSMMKSISGRFTDFEGTVEGGEEQSARGIVRTPSVLTDNEMRDEHLRSNDLLGTGRYPEMRSVGRIGHVDGDRHKIFGDLTVKEAAIPVELDAKFRRRARTLTVSRERSSASRARSSGAHASRSPPTSPRCVRDEDPRHLRQPAGRS
jgi:polyisoprenoid-binding protein YceI